MGGRLYVGMGTHPEHGAGTRFSYFLCLDITKKGDASLKSYGAQAAVNKESAMAKLLLTTTEADQRTASTSLRVSYVGLGLVMLGFALQASAALAKI